ncbi:MAG TPA: serine hydrolase domain-containing protein [Pyrinomonadaceae bacterium]
MTNKAGTVLIVLLLLLAPKVNAQNRSKIGQRLQSFVDEGRIPGAVTLVIREGRILNFEAVGYQDLENKTPMRTDTIFDIRSMTKPVTSIGIMMLMEEGKLALNDAVEKYLPEFKNSAFKDDNGLHPITIRHLLTHTAGLPLYRLPISQEMPIKRNQTLADYVSFLSKQTPEYEPGTQHRYSSGGFAVLGRIIEVVSGMPYDRFIRERVFVPLGMQDSSFFVPVDKQSRLASIYRMQDGKLTKWEELMSFARNAKYPGPEFGMYSTASDLAALCQMLLNGGLYKGRRILSRMSVQQMTSNQTAGIPLAVTHRPAFHGFGFGLAGDPSEDFPLTSHGSFGHNGAFGGIFWVDPEEKLIRIYLEHVFGSGNETDVFMAMAATL